MSKLPKKRFFNRVTRSLPRLLNTIEDLILDKTEFFDVDCLNNSIRQLDKFFMSSEDRQSINRMIDAMYKARK